MEINYNLRMRSQIYKFTDTSLFINYKEYPYNTLSVLSFHQGNTFMNSWYQLETDAGKKLIVGYKPKNVDAEKNLRKIFEYVSTFDYKASQERLKHHRSFEFVLDDETYGNKEQIQHSIDSYIRKKLSSDKSFMLSDVSFDGEIVCNDKIEPPQIEMYINTPEGDSFLCGYAPSHIIKEMGEFLKEENIYYELRMVMVARGIRKKEYIVTALLTIDVPSSFSN